MVGVHSTSRSFRRTEMLPSLAAAKPLAYTFRPISQICSFSLYSFMFWYQVQLIQYARAIRIQRFFLRMKWRCSFDALADSHQVSESGAEVIQHNQVFAVGLLVGP